MTLLELAVWKAKLDKKEDNSTLEVQTKRAKVDVEAMRQKKRITSGASIVNFDQECSPFPRAGLWKYIEYVVNR